MPNIQEFSFDSSTGSNRIFARKVTPDSAPKAVVQISHGIAEHIDRYLDFMLFLASHGYVAVANDHLGHGKTMTSLAEQGIFTEENGWDYVVSDMEKLHDITAAEYPGLPYVMFGHSMGSFLTRTFLIQHPDKYDAAIISGTGHQSRALVSSGLLMAEGFVRFYGPRRIGTKLNDVAFGAYNKAFQPQRTEFDWLSRDEAQVDKYIADPLCGFVARTSLFRDMMKGIKFVTDAKNIRSMSRKQPVYFMSGAMDPVGDNGKGVNKAYKAFCDAGLKDVMIRLYPEGRHEMLNEINKDQVYADVLEWLEQRIG